MKSAKGYQQAAQLTFERVKAAAHLGPCFAVPKKGTAVIASLADVGDRIARNEPARKLVADICAESQRRFGDVPTVMMLVVVLEELGLPTEMISLEELTRGFKAMVRA